MVSTAVGAGLDDPVALGTGFRLIGTGTDGESSAHGGDVDDPGRTHVVAVHRLIEPRVPAARPAPYSAAMARFRQVVVVVAVRPQK
jgi:hypothetical protein